MIERRLARLEAKARALPRTAEQLMAELEGLWGVEVQQKLQSFTDSELVELGRLLGPESEEPGLPKIDFSGFSDAELLSLTPEDLRRLYVQATTGKAGAFVR